MNNFKVKSIIDIGSNSIKMRSGFHDGKKINVIHDETEVVRLGHEVSKTGYLNKNNMLNALKVLSRMINTAKNFNSEIFIFGTMALRTAKNSGEFLKLIYDSTGYEIKILSGHEEAKYSYLGAIDGIKHDENTLIFDTGGGSTELVNLKNIISVPVGAVILTERFFYDNNKPVDENLLNNACEFVRNILNDNNGNNINNFVTSGNIIGVGGGVVAMASVKTGCEIFNPIKLQGIELNIKDIIKQVKLYSSLNLNDRQKIVGLPPSRADVILGSACIVLELMKILKSEKFNVSINGLRHGILLSECKK